MVVMDWISSLLGPTVVVSLGWLISGTFLYHVKPPPDSRNTAVRVARWIFHEVKPFFRAVAIIRLAIYCMDPSPMLIVHVILFGMDLYCYELLKDVDDDDDRWGRRKQRLLDKVSVVNGRLAVTPT